MNKKIFITALCAACFFTTTAQAEITSAECPYSCRTQGIQKKVCKDWRENGRCFIDDLRVRPGQLSRQEEERRRRIEEDKRREEERRRAEERRRYDERYRRDSRPPRYYDDRYRPPRRHHDDDWW